MQPQPENVVSTEFDPFDYWDRHKTKIILFGALILFALAISIFYRVTTERRKSESRQLFGQAENAEGYQKVIAQFPDSVAAANARLLLAAEQRQAGKFDEALATLNEFIKTSPEHPLIAGAWISLAETQAAAGQNDKALATYQTVTTQYPKSYAAPLAQSGAAALLKREGKTAEARQAYETLMSQYPESFYTRQAEQELQFLH